MRGIGAPRSRFNWSTAMLWLPLLFAMAAAVPKLPAPVFGRSSVSISEAPVVVQHRKPAPSLGEDERQYRGATAVRLLLLYGAGSRPFGFFR